MLSRERIVEIFTENISRYGLHLYEAKVKCADAILAEMDEPLEELAKKKGVEVWFRVGMTGWDKSFPSDISVRAYLMGLPDVREEGR